MGRVYVKSKKKKRKRRPVVRGWVMFGTSAKVPSALSQPTNAIASLDRSSTFPKTSRQRLFQRVTGDRHKLKLEL